MRKITQKQAARILKLVYLQEVRHYLGLKTEEVKNRFFYVKFIKRTNREIREMVCRFNVEKYLKGGSLSYKPLDHNLVIVFDTQKMAYRSINLDQILEIKMGQHHYVVEQNCVTH